MYPKLILMDVEGTLIRYREKNGEVINSAWKAIANRLGPSCRKEEEETQAKWNQGGYPGYVEWMRDTILIHKKYGLSRGIFSEVVRSAEFIPGVREAVSEFKRNGAITATISGSFKALSDRVQKELKIDHAMAGCDYFFDEVAGGVAHFNLLPSDEEGKVHFMRLILAEHGLDPMDCVFIGDGKNDIPLAKEVGFSISFNAHDDLRKVSDYRIDQAEGEEDFLQVTRVINEHFETSRGYILPTLSNISEAMKKTGLENNLSPDLALQLLTSAAESRLSAYAPYSKFKVGASVLVDSGEVFSGCNIENASFGATICAERVAIFKAMSKGRGSIKAVAVIANYDSPIPPCGICRQVISEFGEDSIILMCNIRGEFSVSKMEFLFPDVFDLKRGML